MTVQVIEGNQGEIDVTRWNFLNFQITVNMCMYILYLLCLHYSCAIQIR